MNRLFRVSLAIVSMISIVVRAPAAWTGPQPVSAESTSALWKPLPTAGAPAGRVDEYVFWTGREVLIWGGQKIVPVSDVTQYDPSSGQSYAVTTDLSPTSDGARYNPRRRSMVPDQYERGAEWGACRAGVWTGSEMLVWGTGQCGGARYEPGADQWHPMSQIGAPTARNFPAAVWTGDRLLIWGGSQDEGPRKLPTLLDDGASYDPRTDTWRRMSMVGVPAAQASPPDGLDGQRNARLGRLAPQGCCV